ncbi:uncharacterized protein LOC144239296 [Crocuta crocuta]
MSSPQNRKQLCRKHVIIGVAHCHPRVVHLEIRSLCLVPFMASLHWDTWLGNDRGGRILYFIQFIQKVGVDLPAEKPLKKEELVSPGESLPGWRFHAKDTKAVTDLNQPPPRSHDLPGKCREPFLLKKPCSHSKADMLICFPV